MVVGAGATNLYIVQGQMYSGPQQAGDKHILLWRSTELTCRNRMQESTGERPTRLMLSLLQAGRLTVRMGCGQSVSLLTGDKQVSDCPAKFLPPGPLKCSVNIFVVIIIN